MRERGQKGAGGVLGGQDIGGGVKGVLKDFLDAFRETA